MAEKISCSVCGGSLTMSQDGHTLRCQDCGIIYPVKLIKTDIPDSRSGLPVSGAAGDSLESGSGAIFRATGDLSSAEVAVEVAGNPMLASWKTSYGFATLGFAVALLIGAASNLGIMGLAVTACWWVGALIYALHIYPTYFSSAPKLRSPQTISFFNLLFGGPIFGCIWNANLANRHKGYSCFVYGFLEALLGLLVILYIGFAVSTNPLEKISVDAGRTAPGHISVGLNADKTSWRGSYSAYGTAKSSAIEAMVDMGLLEMHAESVFESLKEKDADQAVFSGGIQGSSTLSYAPLWQCPVIIHSSEDPEERKENERRSREEYREAHSYVESASFSYLGRSYRLTFQCTAYAVLDSVYEVSISRVNVSS